MMIIYLVERGEATVGLCWSMGKGKPVSNDWRGMIFILINMLMMMTMVLLMMMMAVMITCSRDFLQEARSSSLGWWAPPWTVCPPLASLTPTLPAGPPPDPTSCSWGWGWWWWTWQWRLHYDDGVGWTTPRSFIMFLSIVVMVAMMMKFTIFPHYIIVMMMVVMMIVIVNNWVFDPHNK